jgi:cysteine desulfurase family protein (TIGR01976 family)
MKDTFSTESSRKEIPSCRQDFPSLERTIHGLPVAYLDGPAGTQVPRQVMEAIQTYYSSSNANTHGNFTASHETEQLLQDTRQVMATFLGSDSASTISFGANMTSLAFALSRAFSRTFLEGDEVVITQLDHEANRGPWLNLQQKGVKVKEVKLRSNGTLDYEDFARKITSATRLVALGMASNALGTVNDIPLIRSLSKKAGAWLLVDAVHFAPHYPIDVKELDVDFLLCSAYKFYGPHVGILYCREGLLETLQTDVLRTQEQKAPYFIETGTLNHASIAGVKAAIEYIASFGHGPDLRSRITDAMNHISDYEHQLAVELWNELKKIPGIRLYGPPFDRDKRTPTLSLTMESKKPAEVTTFLGEQAINCWNGHFYAIRPMEVLKLAEKGGLVRIGMSVYNTRDELLRLINSLHNWLKE